MPNRFYPLGAEKMLRGQIDLQNHVIKAALLSDGYVYSAGHEYLAEAGATTIGNAVTLANKSTTGGVFDADDLNFGALVAGNTGKVVVLYRDTGNSATSPLIAYLDEITGFPFVTNNGELNVPWADGAAKILSLM